MKRLLVIFFCLSYLLSTAGVAVSAHYCMGKLKSLEFYKVNDDCGCEKKENKAKCCKNLVKYFKVKEAHKNVGSSCQASDISSPSFVSNYFVLSAGSSHDSFISSYSGSSPPERSCPVYIENCVFRI